MKRVIPRILFVLFSVFSIGVTTVQAEDTNKTALLKIDGIT